MWQFQNTIGDRCLSCEGTGAIPCEVIVGNEVVPSKRACNRCYGRGRVGNWLSATPAQMGLQKCEVEGCQMAAAVPVAQDKLAALLTRLHRLHKQVGCVENMIFTTQDRVIPPELIKDVLEAYEAMIDS